MEFLVNQDSDVRREFDDFQNWGATKGQVLLQNLMSIIQPVGLAKNENSPGENCLLFDFSAYQKSHVRRKIVNSRIEYAQLKVDY